MNTPSKQLFRLVDPTERIQLKRMAIIDVKITQENPTILYQVLFELTATPHRTWKEVLMETWQSIVRHKGRVSETIIWAFHNRILIDNIPIEIVKNNLETLLNTAIEKTNRKILLKTQATI